MDDQHQQPRANGAPQRLRDARRAERMQAPATAIMATVYVQNLRCSGSDPQKLCFFVVLLEHLRALHEQPGI